MAVLSSLVCPLPSRLRPSSRNDSTVTQRCPSDLCRAELSHCLKYVVVPVATASNCSVSSHTSQRSVSAFMLVMTTTQNSSPNNVSHDDQL